MGELQIELWIGDAREESKRAGVGLERLITCSIGLIELYPGFACVADGNRYLHQSLRSQNVIAG